MADTLVYGELSMWALASTGMVGGADSPLNPASAVRRAFTFTAPFLSRA